MTFIIALAALMLSCVVILAFLSEAVILLWRPAIAVAVLGVVMWAVFRFFAETDIHTHREIAGWVVPGLALAALFIWPAMGYLWVQQYRGKL